MAEFGWVWPDPDERACMLRDEHPQLTTCDTAVGRDPSRCRRPVRLWGAVPTPVAAASARAGGPQHRLMRGAARAGARAALVCAALAALAGSAVEGRPVPGTTPTPTPCPSGHVATEVMGVRLCLCPR